MGGAHRSDDLGGGQTGGGPLRSSLQGRRARGCDRRLPPPVYLQSQQHLQALSEMREVLEEIAEGAGRLPGLLQRQLQRQPLERLQDFWRRHPVVVGCFGADLVHRPKRRCGCRPVRTKTLRALTGRLATEWTHAARCLVGAFPPGDDELAATIARTLGCGLAQIFAAELRDAPLADVCSPARS